MLKLLFLEKCRCVPKMAFPEQKKNQGKTIGTKLLCDLRTNFAGPYVSREKTRGTNLLSELRTKFCERAKLEKLQRKMFVIVIL